MSSMITEIVNFVKKKDFSTIWLILCFIVVGHQIKNYNSSISQQFEQTTVTFKSINGILDKIDRRLDSHSESIAKINQEQIDQNNKIETAYRLWNSEIQSTIRSYRDDQRQFQKFLIEHNSKNNCVCEIK